jgi:drug/metabolite transporter (DMT)-like permease
MIVLHGGSGGESKLETLTEIVQDLKPQYKDVATSFAKDLLGIPGGFCFFLAISIFSSSGVVYVLLNNSDSDVFTSCNMLCAASSYALIFMVIFFVFYRKSISSEDITSISPYVWFQMLCGSTLYSVVGPYFFWEALTNITVPMASIIQRLESINFLLLSFFFLGTEITRWTIISSSFIFLGVFLAIVFSFYQGEASISYLYVIVSGYAMSTSLFISKKYLSKVNTGIVVITRVAVGAVLFHLLSLTMGMKDHLYSSKLWLTMLPYGFVYIFIAQILWIHSLTTVPPTTISIGTNLLFILALIWSALLLRTYPTITQWICASMITIGLALNITETLYKSKQREIIQHTQAKLGSFTELNTSDTEDSFAYEFYGDDGDGNEGEEDDANPLLIGGDSSSLSYVGI